MVHGHTRVGFAILASHSCAPPPLAGAHSCPTSDRYTPAAMQPSLTTVWALLDEQRQLPVSLHDNPTGNTNEWDDAACSRIAQPLTPWQPPFP